jgi:glutathione S-transferase
MQKPHSLLQSVPNINLFIWGPSSGLPSSSPFCLKIIYALYYKGLDHTLIDSILPPQWADRKKLPVAIINGKKIQDSTTILKFLDFAYPDTPLLYPVDQVEKSEVFLLEDWSDESLYWLVVYFRWAMDCNFSKFKKSAFGNLPLPLKLFVPTIARKRSQKKLSAQGISYITDEERQEKLLESVYLMENRLLKNTYLVNNEITAADLSVFSIFKVLCDCQLTEISQLFEKFPQFNRWFSSLEHQLKL